MKIDLSKCRTPQDVEEALRPLGEHMQRFRSAFAKAFGEPSPSAPPAKEEKSCPITRGS